MPYSRLFLSALVLSFIAMGCNGGGSTTPSPTTTTTSAPAGPSAAIITLTILDAGYLASGQGNLVAFEIRLTESAGLGANINFIAVEVFRATGELEERQEIGSGEIINQTGTNRLEANQTRELRILMGFRATIKSGRRLRLTVGMGDDRGNNQDKWETFIFR